MSFSICNQRKYGMLKSYCQFRNACTWIYIFWVCYSLFKKIKTFHSFRIVLGSQQDGGGGTEISHIPTVPAHASPLQLPTSPTRVVPLLVDEPTLTHHDHPKSRVYITVHTCCCTFYGFGQMYNNVYSSPWCHTEYLHCPKYPLCSVYSSLLSPLNSWQPLIFLLSPKFCLFQNVI